MQHTRCLCLVSIAVALLVGSLAWAGQASTPSATAEEVKIAVPDQDVVLAGTILIPPGASADAPVPGVVLITGSGPQDRDETIMGVKPFEVLATAFAARGYAVLRYDDRGTEALGIGKSTGSFAGSTTADFALDAAAAVEHLASREAVDGSKVFVCGHSTGGLVTAKLLSNGDVPAGAILLASPSVIGWKLLAYQSDKIIRETDKQQPTGLTPEEMDEMDAVQTGLVRSVVEGDEAEQRDRAREAIEFNVRIGGGDLSALPDETMQALIDRALAPLQETWMNYFLKYDPADDLRSAGVPVLAVFGGLDVQVVPEQNAELMASYLREAGDDRSAVVTVESQNHLFQAAQTGLLDEYATAGDPMQPIVIDIVVAWMDRVLED